MPPSGSIQPSALAVGMPRNAAPKKKLDPRSHRARLLLLPRLVNDAAVHRGRQVGGPAHAPRRDRAAAQRLPVQRQLPAGAAAERPERGSILSSVPAHVGPLDRTGAWHRKGLNRGASLATWLQVGMQPCRRHALKYSTCKLSALGRLVLLDGIKDGRATGRPTRAPTQVA